MIRLGDQIQTAPEYFKSIEMIDFGELSNVTKNRLKKLKKEWGFSWHQFYKYQIRKKDSTQKATNRCGYFVYGQFGEYLVTYFRKETRSKFAGQTLLYFKSNHIRVTKLLDSSNLNNNKHDLFLSCFDLKKIPKTIKTQKYILKYI